MTILFTMVNLKTLSDDATFRSAKIKCWSDLLTVQSKLLCCPLQTAETDTEEKDENKFKIFVLKDVFLHTDILIKVNIYTYRGKSMQKLLKSLSQPLLMWLSCCCPGWEISFFWVIFVSYALVGPLEIATYFLQHCAESWVPDLLQELNILSIWNSKKQWSPGCVWGQTLFLRCCDSTCRHSFLSCCLVWHHLQ